MGVMRRRRHHSPVRRSSSRPGDVAVASRPAATPATVACSPDADTATHMSTARPAYQGSDRTSAARRSRITAKAATAPASHASDSLSVYTTAMTLRAITSSITTRVSRNVRARAETPRDSESTPSANAVSVPTTMPQPRTESLPAFRATKIRAGTIIPPRAAITGAATRRRSRRSPTSNSRRISSPATKKKMAIRPSLTQSRRVWTRSTGPTCRPASVAHSAS
ncbi:hypothetical protein BJF80_16695 [Serinicoccus sp. CUA-874]|nr:hypothetical protein BJF80_16695 [Serinicoccus sp. CUA-874]